VNSRVIVRDKCSAKKFSYFDSTFVEEKIFPDSINIFFCIIYLIEVGVELSSDIIVEGMCKKLDDDFFICIGDFFKALSVFLEFFLLFISLA